MKYARTPAPRVMLSAFLSLLTSIAAWSAETVPTDVQMPGTQPNEVGNFESPDKCDNCHSAAGWYGGRSTPTDGSGLAAGDDDGVDCDTCHASTNTDVYP